MSRRPLVTTIVLATWVASAARAETVTAPWIAAERGRMTVTWTRGEGERLVANLTLHGPALRVVRRDAPETEAETDEVAEPLPAPGKLVREVAPMPVAVDQIAIHDGSLLFVDVAEPERVDLRIHEVAATIENFSALRASSEGVPMLITARGRIGEHGRIAMFVTVNPWADTLDLAGRVQIVDLRLAEISGLVEREADLEVTAGTISVFVEFSIQDGMIEGAFRPFIAGAELEPADDGLFTRLKAWVATGVISLLEIEAHGEPDRLATTVPFEGRVEDPDVGLWDALLGLISNAFFEALRVGFGRMGPAEGAEGTR
jgi:hypothetical protein